jgi:hypothetical protein
MNKQIVVDKTVYGGMLVEKYFLVLNNGIDIQVPYGEWELYQKGDEYPKRLPGYFDQSKPIEESQQEKFNIFDEMTRLENDLNKLEHYKFKYNNVIEAIKNCHKAKNRYHSQIAWAKLFELADLPAEYPENYERK